MGFKQIVKMQYIRLKYRDRVTIKKNAIVSIKSIFSGANVIGKNTMFYGEIGYGSYIGNDCNINAHIGKYCSLGSNIRVISNTHPTSEFVSTHPVFFSVLKQNGRTFVNENKFNENIYYDDSKELAIYIGNDCWIGDNVTILGGIKINNGAIIGAGSIITKDVPAYSIVVGNPGKVIKYRFSKLQIEALERIKWWDFKEEKLKSDIDEFTSIEKFLRKYGDV